MYLKDGEFTPDAFSGMGGYWCIFCRMSHTSHGCSHPGRAFARQHEWELDKAHKHIEELEDSLRAIMADPQGVDCYCCKASYKLASEALSTARATAEGE